MLDSDVTKSFANERYIGLVFLDIGMAKSFLRPFIFMDFDYKKIWRNK